MTFSMLIKDIKFYDDWKGLLICVCYRTLFASTVLTQIWYFLMS